LRANGVPLIYAFSDGPRTRQTAAAVDKVREVLRAVDWCELVTCEREENWGLGRSILAGVTSVLAKHSSVIVFEDDIECVPGAYSYLSSALEHYANNPEVMSVTGWTNPRVTPSNVNHEPYFDGRAECWVWGTWARSWKGMEQDAATLLSECLKRGIDVYRYGADLPRMARLELKRNIWAVRWSYLHILKGGLCMRPPYALVENIGFGELATNTGLSWEWRRNEMQTCPKAPEKWPDAVENPQCPDLWRSVYGRSNLEYFYKRIRGMASLRMTGLFNGPARLKTVRVNGQSDSVGPVKSLIPPALLPLARRVRCQIFKTLKLHSHIEYEYLGSDWDHAETHFAGKGWNVEDIPVAEKSKWTKFQAMLQGTGPLGISHESSLNSQTDIGQHNTIMTFAYVTALASRGLSAMSILDWGGGIGHYYSLAKTVLPEVTIDYHCKELPYLAMCGAELFPEQHFYSDNSCLERVYDLVLASSSLQYAKDWKDVLSDLAAASRGYLFITRTPLVETAESFVFVQRAYAFGYNTEYLAWCLNRYALLAETQKLGLTLVREFLVSEQPYIFRAPEQCIYRGFLFRSPIDREAAPEGRLR